MGWNDWAHYQCRYTAKTILENARALVSSGLAARGYHTVTVDDCWMSRHRGSDGNLKPNSKRFPQGMMPVIKAIHAMGLKFGIYEDAGSTTCGGFAGSGVPAKGGKPHFVRDSRLFAKWGVDYLKLDGCNIRVPTGGKAIDAYRRAYAAESAALAASGRRIIFLESAPAYFQGTAEWYDVLQWVGQYGQLWREGSDIATFNPAHPSRRRFGSVEWNYAYNLPLGRFQKPGNWNDPDFIIGGDGGMSLAETRSQMALWSMMSAPLILSSDVAKLSKAAVRILGNRRVIGIDQDPLGREATLVQRTPARDVLFKPLVGGDYAVAVFNHGATTIDVNLTLHDFGFSGGGACRAAIRNLWSGAKAAGQRSIRANVASHDTVIWRLHPGRACGKPARMGAIVMTRPDGHHRRIDAYGRCLAASGDVQRCKGDAAERWTVTASHSLKLGTQCLAVVHGLPEMRACSANVAQQWHYRLNGNLVNRSDRRCLGVHATNGGALHWQMQPCGHNKADQIWALPN